MLYLVLWRIFKKHIVIVNLYLCCISLAFYWWGDVEEYNTKIIIMLILVNYFLSYLIRTNINRNARMISAILAVVFDCFVLVRFKYPTLIFESNSVDELIFPLGISFIILHCISYIVDVYKNEVKSENTECVEFVNFALYVLFFPKLTQGPIVQYNDMKDEVMDRTVDSDKLCDGISRFVLGLSKKVLLADTFGNTLSQINSEIYIDTPTAWLSMILFGMQLYFDFPYISTSISEFWRRWHMSLGAWFRKYIYIPLGGNRTGNVYINLFIVFFVTGIWHGNTAIYVCNEILIHKLQYY